MTGLAVSMVIGFLAALLLHRGRDSRMLAEATEQQYAWFYSKLVRRPVPRDKYLLCARIWLEVAAVVFAVIGFACAGVLIDRLM